MDLSAEFDTCVRGKAGTWALRHLKSRGVLFSTIIDAGGIGATLVAVNHGLWSFDPAGKAMIVLPVIEGDCIEDLVAFRPDEPERWYLHQGAYGATLGLETVWEAESYQEPILVHPSPLSWLQAECLGVCVLSDVGRVLAGQSRVVCLDVVHGETIERALRSRMPSIEVLHG